MKYRHYKGNLYQILCEARLESEPDTLMIIYQAQSGEIWARPKQAFFETVLHEGQTVPRFSPIN